MRLTRIPLWIGVLILVCACGGGGGNDGGPDRGGVNAPSAPSGLSYPSPATFVVGSQTSFTPTVTGTVTGYTVSPALPGGLSLDATTGAISGTPTTVTPQSSYTVTATNADGSTSTSVIIVINDAAPAPAYGSSQLTFTVNKPVSNVAPTNSGGTAVSWSISPALPAGLTFSTTNGAITGTPTAVSGPLPYLVSASNPGGQSSFTLSIEVESGVLLHLGHTAGITQLRYDGSRVLSRDRYDHWVLWDAQSGANLASDGVSSFCDMVCAQEIDLAGPTFVIRTVTGLGVYSSADGQQLANLTTPVSWWKLATDGSYLAAGHTSGLTVWSPSGTVLLTRAGDYSRASAFAAPGEIRLGAGPSGANVVETIALASGTSTLGPTFQGQFDQWFLDGERFLTRVTTTVWVYSKSAVQLDIASLPITSIHKLMGWGNWFWTWSAAQEPLRLYAVGASSSPAASYPLDFQATITPSGSTIAVWNPELSIIDLSGTSPSKTDYPGFSWGAYAATTSSQWIVAHGAGLLEDGPSAVAGTHKYYGYGAAKSIAGSSTRIALATAVGRLLYFDAATKALQGEIDLLSEEVELSADGTLLAAVAPDSSVKFFSLPSATEVYTYPSGGTATQSISLSPSGEFLSRLSFSGREIVAIPSGALIWSDTISSGGEAHLSPNGSRIATADGGRCACTGTKLFHNGTFVTALYGVPGGWLDDNRLLINKFTTVNARHYFEGSYVVDGTGQQLQMLPLPELWPIKVVSPQSIYSPHRNTIFSLTTGQPLWEGPTHWEVEGAVAGTRVIYLSGNAIRAETF